MSRPTFRQLKICSTGVTVVEFALVAPVFLALILGTLELGYRLYATAVVNGALREASRMSTTGQYTSTEIDGVVTNTIESFRPNTQVSIDKRSYSDFSGVGVAEPVTSGSVASGQYCYEDVNGNGSWDEDQGKTGTGSAEEVVYYEVTAVYDALFPFSINALGMNPKVAITMNTIVSNEPFAAPVNTIPSTQCV